ncbi:hypothetical protein RN001_013596 [Aquatica leii]|uniref:Uncharacterized protein n=1 Tax=Aquatica leii TaxID=1421715 RepID=A0AAN7P4N2_9COLE|nr:hypothetical protein RN001_013596 [Aquatica leii]
MYNKMVVFLYVIVSFGECSSVSSCHILDVITISLSRLLDFVLDNYEAMNIDGILGISKTRAYLEDILPHINNVTIASQVLKLIYKAETIYFLQLPNLPEYPFKYYVFKTYLLPPNNWKNVTFLNDKLFTDTEIDAKFSEVFSADEFQMYVRDNGFNETFFDDCLVELITAAESCQITQACLQYLAILPKKFGVLFSGYRVTHMLLFLQIARIRKCLYDTQELESMVQKECSYIFWELQKNAEYKFIPKLLDLTLEQIDLCGYEGYSKFFQKRFLDYILRSQHQQGCFKLITVNNAVTKNKRESSVMKHGCNSHATGLAASVLALFLKALSVTDLMKTF